MKIKRNLLMACLIIPLTALTINSTVLTAAAEPVVAVTASQSAVDKPDTTDPAVQTGGKDTKIETERKFLLDLDKIPKDMYSRATKYDIVQTYINYSPEIRVRKLNGNRYYFNLKRPADEIGLSREETQFRITAEEYETLRKKRVGSTIYKTRYQFYDSNTYVFVDVYYGSKLEGLAVAEVEFKSVEEAENFKPLKWFGKDVTSDLRYKNANLAKDGMPESKKSDNK